jgi:hypothetical protein
LTLSGIDGAADGAAEDGPSGANETGADGGSSEAGGDGSNNQGGGDASDGGTPGDCGKTPRPPEAGALFCGDDDAGQGMYCSVGQQCCVGGAMGPPIACAQLGSPCNGVPVECEGPTDCMGAEICCLRNATLLPVMGCGYDNATGGSGTFCGMGTCTQICRAKSECPTGKTCTPLRWMNLELGFCN